MNNKFNKRIKQIAALGITAAMVMMPAMAATQPTAATIFDNTSSDGTDAVVLDSILNGLDKSVFKGPGNKTVRVNSAAQPRNGLFYGTVQFMEGNNNRMYITGVNDAGESEAKVLVTVTDSTRILNATNGDPVALSDVRENEIAYVYTSPVMALSMPPQTSAELILVSIPADYAVPTYVEVDAVRTGNDGSVILSTSEAINITLTGDTTVFPYLTKDMPTKDSIQPGHTLLVWHGPVLESYPGQTTATKVMVFAYGYRGYVSLNGDQFAIGGDTLAFKEDAAPWIDGETYMVPFRQAVEKLGYDIKWDAATDRVTVSLGSTTMYSFVLGEDTCQKDGDTRYLTHAIVEKSGVSYVALDDFLTLHNLKMQTSS